jgi:type II secretory pathway component PulK
MVLIIVLVVVVMVSLAGFSFVATMYNEEKATRLRGDELQAEQLVESGVVSVLAELAEPPGSSAVPAEITTDDPSRYCGILVLDDQDRSQHGRFTVLSPRIDGDQVNGSRYGLENESAKLNLAALLRWEQRQSGMAHEALMRLPGMTESIADAMLDWTDPDDSPRSFGAESEYYGTLDRPYAGRNGPPESIDELLLVRGVTRKLMYGRDLNRNFQVEPEELIESEPSKFGALRDSKEEDSTGMPWSQLLTSHSAERNITPEGQPRINLNDSNLTQLQSQLQQAVGSELANFVVIYRQYGPSSTSDAATPLRESIDMSAPAGTSLTSPLDLVDAKVEIPATQSKARQVLASPLTQQASNFREKLLQLLDYATTIPRPVLRGRININLAASVVLQAVPGIDAGLADRIVSARRGGGPAGGNGELRHPVWPLFQRILDLRQMKAAFPFLTCGGDVYRAQIVGFFDEGGPTYRLEVVFDATQTPPRVVYMKDLRILGRGFSDDVLGVNTSDSMIPRDSASAPFPNTGKSFDQAPKRAL